MTSPEVLDKTDRTLSVAVVGQVYDDLYTDLVIPDLVGTYRSGLGKGSEIGVQLGLNSFPFISLDWKKELYREPNFVVSQDIAINYRLAGKGGVQYDLLFGNNELYGVAGLAYHVWDFNLSYIDEEDLHWVIGVGHMPKRAKGFGIQATYNRMLVPMRFDNYNGTQSSYAYGEISLGISYNFTRTKKQFR